MACGVGHPRFIALASPLAYARVEVLSTVRCFWVSTATRLFPIANAMYLYSAGPSAVRTNLSKPRVSGLEYPAWLERLASGTRPAGRELPLHQIPGFH